MKTFTQQKFSPLLLILVLLGAGCSTSTPNQALDLNAKRDGLLTLTSPAFRHLENLPEKYSCNGEGISPPLQISEVPADAVSLVLTLDDPDAPAGTFNHWVVYGMRANLTDLPAGQIPAGIQGFNSAGRAEYIAPCPPSGTHRYIFTLYATDLAQDTIAQGTKDQIEHAMQGHILEKTQLIGRYGKK